MWFKVLDALNNNIKIKRIFKTYTQHITIVIFSINKYKKANSKATSQHH